MRRLSALRGIWRTRSYGGEVLAHARWCLILSAAQVQGLSYVRRVCLPGPRLVFCMGSQTPMCGDSAGIGNGRPMKVMNFLDFSEFSGKKTSLY